MNPILLSSAFRKQVLSQLYGLPDPTESAEQESEEVKPKEAKEAKEASTDEKEEEEKPVKEDNAKDESEKEASPKELDVDLDKEQEVADKSEKDKDKDKDKDAVDSDHSNNNGDSSAIANNSHTSSSSKSITTHTAPTTTTSHLYSVLMAPLDGRSPYRDHAARSGVDHDTGKCLNNNNDGCLYSILSPRSSQRGSFYAQYILSFIHSFEHPQLTETQTKGTKAPPPPKKMYIKWHNILICIVYCTL